MDAETWDTLFERVSQHAMHQRWGVSRREMWRSEADQIARIAMTALYPELDHAAQGRALVDALAEFASEWNDELASQLDPQRVQRWRATLADAKKWRDAEITWGSGSPGRPPRKNRYPHPTRPTPRPDHIQ